MGQVSRIPSPMNAGARPALEKIWYPLYGARQVAAATTGQVGFFSNLVGQTVDSRTHRTTDTNIQTAGQLANPKTFLAMGIELMVEDLDDAQATPTKPGGAGYSTAAVHHDMHRILHNTFLEFSVGSKKYALGPSFLFPINRGIDGEGFIVGQRADATVLHMARVALYWAGPTFNLRGSPVAIPPMLNFEATLNIPTAISSISATRRVVCVIPGVLGREVI